ncbi:hypothetical protein [Nonomuraea sp. NPDC049400]|uniref:hypothetical protein n=1 Tax=Nonomuraea sp. NPDC049400 TaxID=3364352 RepID=UPI00379F63F6
MEPGALVIINGASSASAEHHQRLGVVCRQLDDERWEVLVTDADRSASQYAPPRWTQLRLSARELTVPADFSIRTLLAKPTDALLVRAMLAEVTRQQAACIAELTAAAAHADAAGDQLEQARAHAIRAYEDGTVSRTRLQELLTALRLAPYDDRRCVTLTVTCQAEISHLRERDLDATLAGTVEIHVNHPHVLVDRASVHITATPCIDGAAA